MKILLCHKFFHITGGAEVFFLEVGRILEKNSHDVAYFSTHSEENIKSDYEEYFVDAPNYVDGSLLKKALSIREMIYCQEAKRKFKLLLKDFHPDVVHVFAIHVHISPSILEACYEMGIPVVMSCNDYKHICPNYKIFDGASLCEACKGGRFYMAVIKRCCKSSLVFSVASSLEAYVHEYKKVYDKFVNLYLFASEFMLNKTKEFWLEKDVQYGVLKNPFDASKYKPVYQGDYVLYFGRIIGEKGVDLIIESARVARLPIKIIGDGPDLKELQKKVNEYGLSHVEFLGAKWGEELNEILYGARFVVVPSLWHENFPYVIFQAFAAGKPVVGSMRGGIPELIGSDRGILFEPDQSQSFANAMIELWNEPERCEDMGRAARKYVVQEFSDNTIYDALISNYKKVM